MKQTESVRLPDLISRYQLEQAGSAAVGQAQFLAQIYHSTALDGHSLSATQIAFLLEIEEAESTSTSAELMILDYTTGHELVTAWATGHDPLTLVNVQQLGACVMQHTGGITNHFLYPIDSRQGEWRTHELSGIGGLYERPHKIKKALSDLIKQTNMNLQRGQTIRQRYETSFWLHYELIRIHPFGEGNGRVARLLMNYVQQYHDLPQSVVFAQDRAAYMAVLNASFQASSSKPFYVFMFSQLTKLLTTNSLADNACNV